MFLASEPLCDLGVRILAAGYSDLSTCRSVGMSVGPVPWLAMVAWCEYHDLDRDVADHAVRVFRAVDAETIRRSRNKQ